MALLLSDVVRYRPRLVAATFLLLLARSLSEGATFLMLIPLLALAGAISSGDAGAVGPQGLERLQAFLPSSPSVELVLLVFLGLVLMRAGLGYAGAVASSILRTGFVEHVRGRLYRAMSRASWMHLAGARQSRDMQALTEQTESASAATFYLFHIAAGLLTVLTGLAVAFALSPRLTLAILAAALVLAGPMLVFQRWAYVRGETTLNALGTLYDVLTARLGGLKLAKAFGIERELEKDFDAAAESYRKAMHATNENTARAALLQEMATAILLAVMVFAALVMLKVPAIELILLIMLFARIAPLASATTQQVRGLAGCMPQYAALRRREADAIAAAEPLPDPAARLELRERLALDAVHFAYPGDPPSPILDGISLSLAARSAIGLVGLSGAGKSTLADVLAGLLPPDRGQVLVDGVPLDAAGRARWRASVAYVPQDAPLFHDTLRANLRIAARDASDAEIWEALDIVQAADLVRGMPQGLDTPAGDRGVRLSGGERQRIRLASALLRRPQLLILDESTNELNPLDEARIVAALRHARPDMTILMIAHRATSVAWTDRVIFVEEGRIAADGPPADVLSESVFQPDPQTRRRAPADLSSKDEQHASR